MLFRSKKGYSETYLKTVNNQLSAIFNYAVRYYDLRDNPCRKAGSIGKSHAGEKEFWTKQEFKRFLVTVENKPETKMAFLLLYWTGMRIGELLALTYNDIDLEKRTISVNKSYQRIEGRDIITPPKNAKEQAHHNDTAVSDRGIKGVYFALIRNYGRRKNVPFYKILYGA